MYLLNPLSESWKMETAKHFAYRFSLSRLCWNPRFRHFADRFRFILTSTSKIVPNRRPGVELLQASVYLVSSRGTCPLDQLASCRLGKNCFIECLFYISRIMLCHLDYFGLLRSLSGFCTRLFGTFRRFRVIFLGGLGHFWCLKRHCLSGTLTKRCWY